MTDATVDLTEVGLDEPFTVTADGTAHLDYDGESTTVAETDPVELFGEDLTEDYRGWSNVSPLYSNGDHYTLHPSEVVSEGMAAAILSRPGRYIFRSLEDGTGWLVLSTAVTAAEMTTD